MKTRVISGAVLFGILLVTLTFGGYPLYIFCGIISMIGLFELYRVFNIHKNPVSYVGYAAVGMLYILLNPTFGYYIHIPEMFAYVAALIALMTNYVCRFGKVNARDVMVIYFGIFYVGLMLSYIYRVRIVEGGEYFVWLIFIGSWVNDTCAYFTGYFLGKHKMAPELSPKKTVEGAIGGIAGSTILGLIYGIILSSRNAIPVENVILITTLAGLIGAFCAIVGDLAASAIKRNQNIKDYSQLIPGHGGILDRFDSVIFTAPVVYWTINFIL